jgi:flagellar motor switch protein FliM
MVEILLPYATLEPIKELLLQMFMGEKFGRDSTWENHLGNEVRSTDVQINAILGSKRLFMNDIVKMKVGTTIMLDQEPDADVNILCGGIPMMQGKLGKMGEKKAIKITKITNKRMRNII